MNKAPTTETFLKSLLHMVEQLGAKNYDYRLGIDGEESETVVAFKMGLNLLAEELEHNHRKINELEELNKNLETFALSAAHDLKTPLKNAEGFIKLLESNHQKVQTYLEGLKQSNEQTSDLINHVLSFHKTGYSNMIMEEVDLMKLIDETLVDFQSASTLKVDCSFIRKTIVFNSVALKQVFSNLISNAVKFNNKDSCEISIKMENRHGYFLFTVSDNGPGINPDDLKKVFDLFENLKNKNIESSGIGLATVKKIILDTGGHVWVENNPKQGSSFKFTIKKRVGVLS